MDFRGEAFSVETMLRLILNLIGLFSLKHGKRDLENEIFFRGEEFSVETMLRLFVDYAQNAHVRF